MITLALQIFLLLLSAYLAGCMVGCMLRRALHEPKRVAVTVAAPGETVAPVRRAVSSPDTARFEAALTGRGLQSAPADEPVVEVRPRPVAAPVARDGTAEIEIVKAPAVPVQREPEPEPEPETLPEPQVVISPETPFVFESQPQPDAETESVATEPEPENASVEPEAEPLPPPPPPPPFTGAAQMASYAAVAAAAAAARAAADAEAEHQAALQEEIQSEAQAEEPASLAESATEAAAESVGLSEAQTAAVLPAEDLKRIRGIDRALEEQLNELGVRRFDDIAGWTADDVAVVSQLLGFAGRIEQENWIEQAQILARGTDTDFSRRQRIAATTTAVGMAAAVASAAATATAQKSAGPDRFTRIIGVDPDTEKVLYDLGFTRYSEIAKWTSSDVERVEAAIGRPGRVGLDNWIEQARVLARYAGNASEPRAAKLADAIRENKAVKVSEPAARPDMAGLRSVKSQALRGEGPAPGDRHEDLKRIRGVGVLIEKRLNALGITSYEQIANWTKVDIDSVSSQLDFRGRIERENWIEQARILASGGQTEFSRRVDRGEVETSKDS